jgi:hypothetical protein
MRRFFTYTSSGYLTYNMVEKVKLGGVGSACKDFRPEIAGGCQYP